LLQPAPPTQSPDAVSTDAPTSSAPTVVAKKVDKPAKPIRTHGAVNEERDRLEVNEEVERTTEEPTFEAGPGTFDGGVEEELAEKKEGKVRSEGVVRVEEEREVESRFFWFDL
jgi:hypothetical protein